jgi:flagellar hook-basal body complex protein FliE
VSTSIAPLAPIAPIGTIEQGGKVDGKDLAESFGKALADARGLENQASDAAQRFASGDPSMGIHEVVIAAEKASIAVRYATTLKNKAVEAYRELMNTQV